ncbi:phospholipase [Salipaludibacillus keqinensis]|uniref:Phospholipase n=1 Tax=Salipaludibacillus keqinensis TaxID=2045207 RepID=A0A323THW7_9BACI|nr:phospholipase D family protein [Salipaludibacillus keqinensis]PYZ94722.1 phospholipase [Salipaludibacillus keqinensis]
MAVKISKKIAFVLFGLVSMYVIYAFISGVLLFQFAEPNKGSHTVEDSQQFYSDELSKDRIVLLEDRYESGLARIHLMENASDSIDVSFYTWHDGLSSDIFFSTIVDAADRGVDVRLLMDGIFHHLRGDLKEIMYAFSYHPNIEIKFYEPFDALRPWTWNNRLHDKLMIVDNERAMVGGRNIGDKYFAPEGYKGASNDRDLVVLDTDMRNNHDSVLKEMEDYFDYIWVHDFSEHPTNERFGPNDREAREGLATLRERHQELQELHSDMFNQDVDWLDKSFPANKVSFIHNPIDRLNKEPLVWKGLASMAEGASKSVLIQSPYVIPTENMMEHIHLDEVTSKEVSILTNSLSATSNVLAYSGYSRVREDIVDSGLEIYEFQGPSESLHGKTFVFDDRVSAVGSFNVDPRSTFLSTEVMVVVDSEEFAEALTNNMEDYMKHHSLKVAQDGTYKEHAYVQEEEVSLGKSGLTWGLSLVTRYFLYLI